MDIRKIQAYADRVKQEDHGLDRRIIARVVGVTFDGRQEVLASMDETTPVRLERDRRNEYDPHAVKVLAQLDGEWRQAGFVSRHMSKLIGRSLDNGISLSAAVHRVTGGFYCELKEEMASHGLEISITPE